jgi:SNF2 family DNA or RNA helicase
MELFPFQRAGARFLTVAGSALLADEMGLGKTVQTIASLEAAGSYPALVVCPNSVKEVWRREFARWAPHRVVKVAGSGTATASRAVQKVANGLGDVLVLNWEALRSLSRLAPYGSKRLLTCSKCDPLSTRRPGLCQREDKVLNLVSWAAVVADEAHRAKNPDADQTRALWALGDRAGRRIALTGTPIANSAEDLWAIMRFVSPAEYPAKWPWIERYANRTPNIWSGGFDVQGLRADRREELDRYFLPRFARRQKAEVLPDLPPKVYERRDVVLTGTQKKAYDQLAKDMTADLESGTLVATNVLTASLRLRQLASAYGVVTTTAPAHDDPMAQVEQQMQLEEPSSKLDVLEEVLAELGDRPAVVFAESRQLIELAHLRLTDKDIPSAMLTGAIAQGDRSAAVEAFQGGKVRVLLLTTGAGSEGLTLTAADTAIFLQRPWSAVQNAQAEDRIHRIGQEAANVTIIDLVAVNTVEQHVAEALEVKAERLEELVRDADTLRRWLS